MQLFKSFLGSSVQLGASYFNHIVFMNILADFEELLYTDGRTLFYNSTFILEVFYNFPNIFTNISEVYHDFYGVILAADVDTHQLHVTSNVVDYYDMCNHRIYTEDSERV